MQKIATRVFIYASIAFGIFGVILVLTLPNDDGQTSDIHIVFIKLVMACGFIILSSFALSVAGKYLSGKG